MDQRGRRVLDERAIKVVRGIRNGLARASLVEDDNLVVCWVEEATGARRAPCTRAAVQKYARHAVRVAAQVVVQLVIADIQVAGLKRLYLRVEIARVRDRIGDLVGSI